MSLRTLVLASTLAATASISSPVWAQDYDSVRLGSATREGGRVGGALIVGSKYKGSDETKVSALPFIEYRWANGFFAGLGSGLGYEFLREANTNAGVRLTPDFGRKESRADALKGMGDVKAKPEIGLYLNHAFPGEGIGVHGSVRYGAGGSGLEADLGVAYGLPLGSSGRLRLGAAATFANASYMQTFFGVSPEQSVTSGYAVFTPHAGLRDTKLSATVLYSLSSKWVLTTGLTATTLQADAANSPLTRARTSAGLVVSVSYGF